MIKSACGAEQFAFAAVQLRSAIHAIVPKMFFRLNNMFGNTEIQQRRDLFDFVPALFHCVTNLTKCKVESKIFLYGGPYS
jgi:hypothetical protein